MEPPFYPFSIHFQDKLDLTATFFCTLKGLPRLCCPSPGPYILPIALNLLTVVWIAFIRLAWTFKTPSRHLDRVYGVQRPSPTSQVWGDGVNYPQCAELRLIFWHHEFSRACHRVGKGACKTPIYRLTTDHTPLHKDTMYIWYYSLAHISLFILGRCNLLFNGCVLGYGAWSLWYRLKEARTGYWKF